ncbi:hypothetical protein CHLNCDRAFT_141860 [Chlorella variabilis]|uniref:Uncharacterized protein n=1 Tax=Chlorella variabilis TaxID=554065 RepID=E1Z776_CHLVA|nr:hypothetical protein CHLNCDRAFT_141860 [Chlorella variabilis]EFN58122.1 hypothetical protein CHLNCDRAFT_141860 [Chlorella variabilis]|eukprot:XP_005850224.1 hypothetical protein CHLNCDRAFT_141860 [Chlorella variabilis]
MCLSGASAAVQVAAGVSSAPLAVAALAPAQAAEAGQCGETARTAAAGVGAEAPDGAEAMAAEQGQRSCRKRRLEEQVDGSLQATVEGGPTAPSDLQDWWLPVRLLHLLHYGEFITSMNDIFFAGKRLPIASSKRRKVDTVPATATLPPAAEAAGAQNGAAAGVAEAPTAAPRAAPPTYGPFVVGRATPAAHTRGGGRRSLPHSSRSATPAAPAPAARSPRAAALAAGGVSQHGASPMTAAAAAPSPTPSRKHAMSAALPEEQSATLRGTAAGTGHEPPGIALDVAQRRRSGGQGLGSPSPLGQAVPDGGALQGEPAPSPTTLAAGAPGAHVPERFPPPLLPPAGRRGPRGSLSLPGAVALLAAPALPAGAARLAAVQASAGTQTDAAGAGENAPPAAAAATGPLAGTAAPAPAGSLTRQQRHRGDAKGAGRAIVSPAQQGASTPLRERNRHEDAAQSRAPAVGQPASGGALCSAQAARPARGPAPLHGARLPSAPSRAQGVATSPPGSPRVSALSGDGGAALSDADPGSGSLPPAALGDAEHNLAAMLVPELPDGADCLRGLAAAWDALTSVHASLPRGSGADVAGEGPAAGHQQTEQPAAQAGAAAGGEDDADGLRLEELLPEQVKALLSGSPAALGDRHSRVAGVAQACSALVHSVPQEQAAPLAAALVCKAVDIQEPLPWPPHRLRLLRIAADVLRSVRSFPSAAVPDILRPLLGTICRVVAAAKGSPAAGECTRAMQLLMGLLHQLLRGPDGDQAWPAGLGLDMRDGMSSLLQAVWAMDRWPIPVVTQATELTMDLIDAMGSARSQEPASGRDHSMSEGEDIPASQQQPGQLVEGEDGDSGQLGGVSPVGGIPGTCRRELRYQHQPVDAALVQLLALATCRTWHQLHLALACLAALEAASWQERAAMNNPAVVASLRACVGQPCVAAAAEALQSGTAVALNANEMEVPGAAGKFVLRRLQVPDGDKVLKAELIALRAIRDKFVRGAAHVVATELVLLVPFGLADLSSRIRFLVAFSGEARKGVKGQGPFWFNLQQARQELGRDADGIKMAAAALSQMKLAGQSAAHIMIFAVHPASHRIWAACVRAERGSGQVLRLELLEGQHR